jgi:hypothetical protein
MNRTLRLGRFLIITTPLYSKWTDFSIHGSFCIKTMLGACWFPCMCSNHNKNKMCSERFFFSREKRKKRNWPLPFVSFVYRTHIQFDGAFALFFSLMMKMYIERVCSVLKQYLHLILFVYSRDAIQKLIIFIKRQSRLMTGGNHFQGHPVNEHWKIKKRLTVCSVYHGWHQSQGYN